MNKKTRLSDYDNSLVKSTAERLTKKEKTTKGKVEKIFYYVRDGISFAFPPKGDFMKASETIRYGKGQCNTKSTLFLALCQAIGIEARIHFSLIKKEIQRGLFTNLAYKIMPDFLSHSWIEVKIDETWKKIDSFINDNAFYLAGKKKLREQKWDTGYSISCSNGESSSDFNIDKEKFVQMDAVTADHGVWNEPSDYYKTDLYQNNPSFIKVLMYRFLIIGINKKIKKMRKSCTNGLCG